MKTLKRNAVILSVLLFVCVAVYLNWQYNKKDDAAADTGAGTDSTAAETAAPENGGDTQTAAPEDTSGAEDKTESAGLYYTQEDGKTTMAEYFANVRLNRSQARDSAVQTLSTVSETEGASQETIDEALSEIARVAEYTMKEAELEGLILAKGFDDCVVYINDVGIDVTVPAPGEGLSTAAVARITDVVTSETDFTAENLKVIEVKG